MDDNEKEVDVLRIKSDTQKTISAFKTMRYAFVSAAVIWGFTEVSSIFETIASVAGTVDSFVHLVELLALGDILPWILTICASIWAFVEIRLRRNKTIYLAKRISELEKQIDQNRTSSGLLSDGRTHPNDKEVM